MNGLSMIKETRITAVVGRDDPPRLNRPIGIGWLPPGLDPGAGATMTVRPNRIMLRKGGSHVPQHPPPVQFRAARQRNGNPSLRASVRTEGERLQQAFAG